MTKKCTKCGEEKDISNFGKKSNSPDGFSLWCKQCKANANKKYYANNKDKIAKYKTEWWHKNKDSVKVRFRKWYDENRESIYKKEVEKRKSNPELRIKHNLRTRIGCALNGIGAKSDKTVSLIGCDIDFFIAYIESKFKDGMSWDNYGKNGWHIDHIKPCASFDLTDPDEQKRCFHYTNMQPLWAEENYSKGANITA